MGKLSEKRSRKFRIEPFLKGLQVSKGQSPLLALKTDIHTFSQLKNVLSRLFRAAKPKILSKNEAREVRSVKAERTFCQNLYIV